MAIDTLSPPTMCRDRDNPDPPLPLAQLRCALQDCAAEVEGLLDGTAMLMSLILGEEERRGCNSGQLLFAARAIEQRIAEIKKSLLDLDAKEWESAR